MAERFLSPPFADAACNRPAGGYSVFREEDMPAKTSGKLTVATFNVNSVRSRLETLVPWLGEHQPDVLCMQEIKCEDQFFPAAEFEKLGYRSAFYGQKSYNGTAIIARGELSDVSRGLGDGLDGAAGEPARLIRARFRGVNIVNTYVPQGRDMETEHYAYKLKWLARLRAFFEREYTPKQKLLWVGDMNVAPTELDLHDPKGNQKNVCFSPEIRARLASVAEWGFTDLFRKHHAEPGQYSFYDYRVKDAVKRGLGWRVDHIMATAPMAECSSDCWIDLAPRIGEKPSDHCPVLAEFEL